MSQNSTIQRKEVIGSFLYTLYKSGQIALNDAFCLHREAVKRTFVIRTSIDSHPILSMANQLINIQMSCSEVTIPLFCQHVIPNFLDNKGFISRG